MNLLKNGLLMRKTGDRRRTELTETFAFLCRFSAEFITRSRGNTLGRDPLALINDDARAEQFRHLRHRFLHVGAFAPRMLMQAVIAHHVVMLTHDHAGAYRSRSLTNSGIYGARDFTLIYQLDHFLAEVATSQYAMCISTRSLLVESTSVPSPDSVAPPLRTLCFKYR